MDWFDKTFKPSSATTILDVGGSQFNWQFIRSRPHLVIVNLAKPNEWDDKVRNTEFEVGDGRSLRFANRSFDIAYSNSVIEHLSNWENQRAFAKEMLRVGKAVYVQTPAKEFFMEPHLLTPFIHHLPLKWQSKLTRNLSVWGLITRPTQAYVEAFLAERRLLSFVEFGQLFPDCEIIREKFLSLTKSYIAVRQE